MLVGWLQGKRIMDMFTIGVRWTQKLLPDFSLQTFLCSCLLMSFCVMMFFVVVVVVVNPPQSGGGSHPRGSSHRGDGDSGAGCDEDGEETSHRQEAAHRRNSEYVK